ncbi:MAG TPA: phosphatase PAP2 family protein [Candidatus Kapabacteria bacterium]|nr:phosphatase PAP2 family protein [Candidatus Kapabacteria bacterium]
MQCAHPLLTLLALLTAGWLFPLQALHAATFADADSLTQQPPGPPAIGDTIWTDVKESAEDAVLLFSRPARFDRTDWLLAGGSVAATGLGMTADGWMRDRFRGFHSTAMDRATDAGNYYGTPLPAAIVAGGLYLTGLVFDNSGVRRAGRHVVQSALYAGIITVTLKTILGRHRPMLNQGPFVYSGPTVNDDFNSLPSGHTTLAFALSSALAADIDNAWASVGLYGVATLTAASRIYADRHWFSDTILGAVIGTACGYGVVHLHDPESKRTGLLLYPTINGIGATYRF